MESSTTQMISSEKPQDKEGRTYHVYSKKGEVANRIICVGDLGRAEKYAKAYLAEGFFKLVSARGFATYTGLYQGVPVTILGTGMGIPMTDFSIRECCDVIDGEVVMIRLGTCGTVCEDIKLGTYIIHDKAICCIRNPDAFMEKGVGKILPDQPYLVFQPVEADKIITDLLLDSAKKIQKDSGLVIKGMDCSCDTFYASQGRQPSLFNDKNENLIDDIIKQFKDLKTLEMETYHMYDLSKHSNGKLRAGGMAMVIAQRKKGDFIDVEEKEKIEKMMGKVGLDAIVQVKIKDEMKGPHCVWEKKNV